MQSVRAPALITADVRARRLRSAALALVAVLVLGAAVGLGAQQLLGTGAIKTHANAPVALLNGRTLQQARCAQWLTASASERSATIAALRGVVGGPTPWGPATTLTAAEATTLFRRTCSHGYARNFLLYELYTRAAGFRSVTRAEKPGV
jgi:hypothetical protein